MPLIIDHIEQTAYAYSDWGDMPLPFSAELVAVTHPDEPAARPGFLSSTSADFVEVVPSRVYEDALRDHGWPADALYAEVCKHISPPADPLAGYVLSPRQQKKLDRKLASLAAHGRRAARHSRAVKAAIVKSMKGEASSRYAGGADVFREVRETRRHTGLRLVRDSGETLWEYFLRRYNRGVNPNDLPAKLDVRGAFVGLELEFVPPYDTEEPDDRFSLIDERDFAIFGAGLHHDGSIQTDDGYAIDGLTEAVILLRPPHYRRLKMLCDQLLRRGCRVNSTCGVHLHVDVRHLGSQEALRQRVEMLVASLPVLACLVDRDRIRGQRAERYCRFGVSPSTGYPSDHYDPNRYWAVNLCSVPRQGTVEMRLLHGSLNFDELVGWATLVRHVLLSAAKPLRTVEDLMQTGRMLGITPYLEANLEAEPEERIAMARSLLARSAEVWGRIRDDGSTALYALPADSEVPPPSDGGLFSVFDDVLAPTTETQPRELAAARGYMVNDLVPVPTDVTERFGASVLEAGEAPRVAAVRRVGADRLRLPPVISPLPTSNADSNTF